MNLQHVFGGDKKGQKVGTFILQVTLRKLLFPFNYNIFITLDQLVVPRYHIRLQSAISIPSRNGGTFGGSPRSPVLFGARNESDTRRRGGFIFVAFSCASHTCFTRFSGVSAIFDDIVRAAFRYHRFTSEVRHVGQLLCGRHDDIRRGHAGLA